MKPRKTISIYVLLVGVMGLLIVGGVLSFQLFDEATKSQLPASQRDAVRPIDGKIEEKVLENLSKRKLFSRDELINVPTPTIAIVVSPVATVASEASVSAAISASPEATIKPER